VRKIKYKKGRKVKPQLLDYTGIYKEIETKMQLFVYDENEVTEVLDFDVEHLDEIVNTNKVNWLNVHGLNNIETIAKIGDYLNVDHFILGDILNTTKRTKLDENHDVLFFNIKSILPVEGSDTINVEQISFLLKDHILVSFQEKPSDFFTHIRERIRTKSGIVRTKKADYLLYLLLDAVMENFYITIEEEEDRVEALIDLSKSRHDLKILEKIEIQRDNINFLKRSIIPLRDSLYSIKSIKDDNVFNFIEDSSYTFFDRLHQKSLELLEQIDYDLVSLDSASNFYFSTQNQKLNQVMKTLTIVSVLFIPLTFIVGVYGMNFENMPELHFKNGYYYVLGFMFLLLVGMIIYFKKKRWF
jgi:magnesium transporter